MGLFGFLKSQLIDIIEWNQESESDVMAWRFPRADNEIKNGAQLIVREGQQAVLVDRGRLADVFGPGQHTLNTANIPILTRLKGWKYGFESPFKCEVYFIATRRFVDLKWGTANPIMMRDKEFGIVRVRAYGTYAIQVSDPIVFLRQLIATDPTFHTYEIATQLRNLIVTRFSDAVASSGLPVLDIAANLDELSDFSAKKIAADFAEMGFSVPIFLVENVSLPPNVEEVFDKRTSMGIIGNLDQYMKFQTANAMEAAANSSGGEGGGAGLGAGLGVGMGMAQQMMNTMNTAGQPNQPQYHQHQQQPTGAPPPPPIPQPVQIYAALNGTQAGPFDLNELKQKIQAGEIEQNTLVWKQGYAGWIKASDSDEVAGLFGAAPPPIPPS